MASQITCGICELPEEKCLCEKYCSLCLGYHQVRLCNDQRYYCLECREACDMLAVGAVGRS